MEKSRATLAGSGVVPMERTNKNCTGMDSKLADMLLDPSAVPAKVQTHVAECDQCRNELAELKATMQLLDAWEGPEPSPYFLTRLDARMREEREAEPAGWFASRIARMRDRLAYGPRVAMRPLVAMALTAVLLVGGGTYLGITEWVHAPQASGQAAVVGDLETLDNNAQLLDQMEAISSNDSGD